MSLAYFRDDETAEPSSGMAGDAVHASCQTISDKIKYDLNASIMTLYY